MLSPDRNTSPQTENENLPSSNEMISSQHKKNESNPDLNLNRNIGSFQIKNESIVKFKTEIVDIISQSQTKNDITLILTIMESV